MPARGPLHDAVWIGLCERVSPMAVPWSRHGDPSQVSHIVTGARASTGSRVDHAPSAVVIGTGRLVGRRPRAVAAEGL